MVDENSHTLVDLPAEVRLNVYQYLFEDANIKLRLSHSLKLHYQDDKVTSIFRVCRLLRQEAMPVFFDNVCFHGNENVFDVLKTFAGDYGELVDFNMLRKIVTQSSRFFMHETPFIKWIGESQVLKDVTCHIKDSILYSGMPDPDKLQQSETLRVLHLGHIMRTTYIAGRKLSQRLDGIIVKMNRPQNAKLKVVIYLNIGNMEWPYLDDWIMNVRVSLREKRTEFKINGQWTHVPQSLWAT